MFHNAYNGHIFTRVIIAIIFIRVRMEFSVFHQMTRDPGFSHISPTQKGTHAEFFTALVVFYASHQRRPMPFCSADLQQPEGKKQTKMRLLSQPETECRKLCNLTIDINILPHTHTIKRRHSKKGTQTERKKLTKANYNCICCLKGYQFP